MTSLVGYNDEHNIGGVTNTNLHDAVYRGDAELVESLLQNGVYKDVLNKHCESAVHIAVKTHSIEILKLLVNSGCDVNICENFAHVTPVHFAVNTIDDKDEFEVILLTLLKGGCRLNWRAYSTLESPFYRSLELQKPGIAALLLKYGADPSLESPFGVTVLHKLCARGDVYLTRLVLHCGVNWNQEVWLTDRFSDEILKEYNRDLVNYIVKYRYSVTPLFSLCRMKLRHILQDGLFKNVGKLPLPNKLKQHLFLSDIL